MSPRDASASTPATDRFDFARDLEAQRVGRARRRRVEAGALHQVGTIDAGGGDADQDFTGTGRWALGADKLQRGVRAVKNFAHVLAFDPIGCLSLRPI